MERRNTIQREMVYNAVVGLKNHPTADEVYATVVKEHPNIGKGTVYRNLNLLSEDGTIRKVEIPDRPHRYDYKITEHYHIRCIKCGRVDDVSMSSLPDIIKQIDDISGYRLLSYDILFKGICSECQKNMEG